jgi:hypothetical protein
MHHCRDLIGEKREVIMTDKQIIETLEHIKGICTLQTSCNPCRFHSDNIDIYCQIIDLIHVLGTSPQFWDMEEIERIINETD